MSSGDVAMYLILGLVMHGFGDYVLQSNWMALEKTKRWWPVLAHGGVYSSCFVGVVAPFGWRGVFGLLIIGGTHVVLDRYRLARYVVWAKNQLLSPESHRRPWRECRETGFPPETPEYMAKWLLIIVDNVIHIWINSLVIIWMAGWHR